MSITSIPILTLIRKPWNRSARPVQSTWKAVRKGRLFVCAARYISAPAIQCSQPLVILSDARVNARASRRIPRIRPLPCCTKAFSQECFGRTPCNSMAASGCIGILRLVVACAPTSLRMTRGKGFREETASTPVRFQPPFKMSKTCHFLPPWAARLLSDPRSSAPIRGKFSLPDQCSPDQCSSV